MTLNFQPPTAQKNMRPVFRLKAKRALSLLAVLRGGGPKPITDRPTKRFEGKAYPEQIVKLVELETRLTMEAKSIPSAERRRITLNTFVRLGLEVVLAHADNLTGANEDELLESLRRSISSNPAARSSRK